MSALVAGFSVPACLVVSFYGSQFVPISRILNETCPRTRRIVSEGQGLSLPMTTYQIGRYPGRLVEVPLLWLPLQFKLDSTQPPFLPFISSLLSAVNHKHCWSDFSQPHFLSNSNELWTRKRVANEVFATAWLLTPFPNLARTSPEQPEAMQGSTNHLELQGRSLSVSSFLHHATCFTFCPRLHSVHSKVGTPCLSSTIYPTGNTSSASQRARLNVQDAATYYFKFTLDSVRRRNTSSPIDIESPTRGGSHENISALPAQSTPGGRSNRTDTAQDSSNHTPSKTDRMPADLEAPLLQTRSERETELGFRTQHQPADGGNSMANLTDQVLQPAFAECSTSPTSRSFKFSS